VSCRITQARRTLENPKESQASMNTFQIVAQGLIVPGLITAGVHFRGMAIGLPGPVATVALHAPGAQLRSAAALKDRAQ
jgi:hypothetical protein